MMKKRISSILLLVFLFCLAACSAQKSPEGSLSPDAVNAKEQNPIMNFVGMYGHDRATVQVEAADAADGVKLSVIWSSSAAEHSEWAMTGTFDANKRTITYDDCVKVTIVYTEDGDIESETVIYKNGKGTITFPEGEKLTLTWDDAEEHIADNTVFEYTSIG